VRPGVILIGLLIAACAAPPQRAEPLAGKPVSLPAHRSLDTLCLDDCLGDNAGKEFCEDRCAY